MSDKGSLVLAFFALGSAISIAWLGLEIWVRLAPVKEVGVLDLEQVPSNDRSTTYRRALVALPGHESEPRWVWIALDQYEAAQDGAPVDVRIRRIGPWIYIRGVRQWVRVVASRWAALFFTLNLGINIL